MLQSRRKPQYLGKGETHTYHPIQPRNVTLGHELEGNEGFCLGKGLHTNAPSSLTHDRPTLKTQVKQQRGHG